jgi:hypothetical protein
MLSYHRTIILSYRHYVIPPNSYTIIRSYLHTTQTDVPQCYHTIIPPYCRTAELSYRHTKISSYRHTFIPPYHQTFIQNSTVPSNYTIIPPYHHIVKPTIPSHRRTIIQPQCNNHITLKIHHQTVMPSYQHLIIL